MAHTLRVTVDADVLPGPVQVTVHGCLTESSFPALQKVLDRGISMEGCPEFRLDLRDLQHMDRPGLDSVERFIDQHNQTGSLPVMSLRAPSEPRHCGQADSPYHASAEISVQPGDFGETSELEQRQVQT